VTAVSGNPHGFRMRHVALAQAGFYLGTGAWPLLHRRSFEFVTGRKRDFWLVQTVGVLVGAVGLGLGQAALSPGKVPREVRTIAIAGATGLTMVDLWFVTRGRISKVYLADAAAELALVVAWRSARG
jgi:hypothetical protein